MKNHSHSSGATSSHLAPDYAAIPESFIRRLADRFSNGTCKHGRGNWRRCYELNPIDAEFLRDRYNHAVEHLNNFKESGSSPDDNLAAVAWFLAIAAEAEDVYAIDWRKVLQVETPDDEAARKKANDYFMDSHEDTEDTKH